MIFNFNKAVESHASPTKKYLSSHYCYYTHISPITTHTLPPHHTHTHTHTFGGHCAPTAGPPMPVANSAPCVGVWARARVCMYHTCIHPSPTPTPTPTLPTPSPSPSCITFARNVLPSAESHTYLSWGLPLRFHLPIPLLLVNVSREI